MPRINCEVVGSEGDIYDITIESAPGALAMFCTCKAGENGQWCNHRLRLLDGDFDHLVGKPSMMLRELKAWLVGTSVERALKERALAAAEKAAAERRVKEANAALSRALRGL